MSGISDDRHETACDLTEDMAPYRVGCPNRICVSNLKVVGI